MKWLKNLIKYGTTDPESRMGPRLECFHCGQTSRSDAFSCRGCGAPFPESNIRQSDRPAKEAFQAKLVDLHLLEDGFTSKDEELFHPNWPVVIRHINKFVSQDEVDQAWREVVTVWVDDLAERLGPGYRRIETEHVTMLCDLPTALGKELGERVETLAKMVRRHLGKAAWTGFDGKHVLLLFGELEEYHRYISHYYPTGTHRRSPGLALRTGYVHIAQQLFGLNNFRRAFVALFATNLMVHLAAPAWVTYGIADGIELTILRSDCVPTAYYAETLEIWHENDIQLFWSGTAFDNELSSAAAVLARALVNSMEGNWQRAIEFATKASFADGGAAAFKAEFGLTLGKAASQILGTGDWEPNPKAIRTLQQSAG